MDKKLDLYYDVKLSLYQLHILEHALGISDKLEWTNQPIWKITKSYRNRYYVREEQKLEDAFDDLINNYRFMQWETSKVLVVNDQGVKYLETLFRTKIKQSEEDIYIQK